MLRVILRRALLVAVALTVFCAVRGARAGVARPVHERRLGNGLRVVVSPDPAGVEVSVVVRYGTGARDEPGGLEGLAHLVEHVMFFGSRHVEPGGFARILEEAGGTNLNAITNLDSTTYFETLPPERLELGLWLESDRMGYGLDRLDEATLARARAEVLNERRERFVQPPLGALPVMVFGELFPSWHPYHHLPIGLPTSIAGVRLADVRAFFNTWYGPDNAVVVIAGKVEPGAALALVERYFGSLPARPPPVRPSLPGKNAATAATVLGVGANVTRDEVRLAWVTPAVAAPGDGELELAAAILVDRGAGWLERRLLASPRLCTQVSAAQEPFALASLFEIRAVIAEGRSAKEVLRAVLESLQRFEGGVDDDEIRRARLVFQNNRLFGLESSLAVAQTLAARARMGALPPAYDADFAKYEAITPRAVRDVVGASLGNRPWLVTMSHPTRTLPTAGELLGRMQVPWGASR